MTEYAAKHRAEGFQKRVVRLADYAMALVEANDYQPKHQARPVEPEPAFPQHATGQVFQRFLHEVHQGRWRHRA